MQNTHTKIKTHTLASWLVVLALAAGWASGAPAPAPKSEESKGLSGIFDDFFATGMQLGYAATKLGATKEDINFLIETKRRNDIGALNKWFDEHDKR